MVENNSKGIEIKSFTIMHSIIYFKHFLINELLKIIRDWLLLTIIIIIIIITIIIIINNYYYYQQ